MNNRLKNFISFQYTKRQRTWGLMHVADPDSMAACVAKTSTLTTFALEFALEREE
jgi:hypothetical protein